VIRIVPSLWLTVIWVALWGDLTALNVVGGLLLAVAVQAVVPIGRRSGPRGHVRPLRTALLVPYFVGKLAVASLDVAREALRPRIRIREGIVAVPLRTDSPMVAAFVANFVALTPGTLVLELELPMLYVHVLNLDDPEAVRREIRKIERLALKAFGNRPRPAGSPHQGEECDPR